MFILEKTTLKKFINKLLFMKMIIIEIKSLLAFKGPTVEQETSLN